MTQSKGQKLVMAGCCGLNVFEREKDEEIISPVTNHYS